MKSPHIIEAADIPVNEKVYLKKDFLGWRVVEPWTDPETGVKNWFNILLGGKKGLFFVSIVVVIAVLLYFGINELLAQGNACLESIKYQEWFYSTGGPYPFGVD